MVQQMSRLMEYLECLPVQTFSLDNMEADDVISYVANNAHTWKLIDGQTIEKDGKRLSFKGRLI